MRDIKKSAYRFQIYDDFQKHWNPLFFEELFVAWIHVFKLSVTLRSRIISILLKQEMSFEKNSTNILIFSGEILFFENSGNFIFYYSYKAFGKMISWYTSDC